MTPGLPGAGIAGLFYLLAALFAPLCEAVRTIRGRRSQQQRRLVLRHFLLAASILMGLWLTAWAVSLFLTSGAVLTNQAVPADATRIDVISRRIALSTVTTLALVLAAVEALRLIVIRRNRRGSQPVTRYTGELSARLPASRVLSEADFVLLKDAREKSV